MKRSLRLLTLAVCALIGTGFVSSQDGGKRSKKDRRAPDEDAMIVQYVEKALKLVDTERDRFIRELVRLDPKEPLQLDFDQWFARLAAGSPNWERERPGRKNLVELFDRAAMRLGVEDIIITPAQFRNYANRYLGRDDSPPWREPKSLDSNRETTRLFEYLDRDDSKTLSNDEMPDALRSDLNRWDKNGDGKISYEEYAVYFPVRLEYLRQEFQNSKKEAAAPKAIDPNDPASLMRAAKLPPGLPAWFGDLDSDRDGQIALLEWRKTGWPLPEFEAIDLNDDGFLVPDEFFRAVMITNREGARPFEYLLKKTRSNVAKKSVGGRK